MKRESDSSGGALLLLARGCPGPWKELVEAMRYAINGGIRLSDAMGRPLHAPNHELPNEASPVTL